MERSNTPGSRGLAVLLCSALAVAAIAPLRERFCAALGRNLPFGLSAVPLPVAHSSAGRTPVRLAATWARRLAHWTEATRHASLDPELDPFLRLGAAELYRRLALVGGDPSADEFDQRFEVLQEAVAGLGDDPAITPLLADALRVRLKAVDADRELAVQAAEQLRAVLRLGPRFPGGDGSCDLYEAALLGTEKRWSEARDCLLQSVRSERIDCQARWRTAAAHAWLVHRGVPELEAREFVLLDEVIGDDTRAGTLLRELADALGAADAIKFSRRGQLDPACITTERALAVAGMAIAQSALVVSDAADAVGAHHRYREQLGASPAAGSRSDRSTRPGERPQRGAPPALAPARESTSVPDSDLAPESLKTVLQEWRWRQVTPGGPERRVTALHSLAASWIVVLLIAAALAWVLEARWKLPPAPANEAAPPARGRRGGAGKTTPHSPGLAFIALFVAPVILFKSESGALGAWLGPLDEPSFLRVLLPLAAFLPVLLPCLLDARFRTRSAAAATIRRFAVRHAALLLLLFAATTPLVLAMREARSVELNAVILDRHLPSSVHWPAIEPNTQ